MGESKQGPQRHGERILASSVTRGPCGELQRNLLGAQRCPGLLLSNGYLPGLYGARQLAVHTDGAVGGWWWWWWWSQERRGLSAISGTIGSSQESPYIWRVISRSLDLGITQVGAARLWVHDDLSPSPGQEVAYLGPGAPALGSSWSGWTHAPWRPEPQRTCQRWHERQVPHCACATRRVGARTR